jgi:hypothetical protein
MWMFSTVMDFLRNDNYNGYGFFLKDLYVTKDYAGSCDKYKVIDHLTSMEGFRELGTVTNGEECPRTIVDNS